MVERTSDSDVLKDALRELANELADGIKEEIVGVRADLKGLAAELGNLRIDVAVQGDRLSRMESTADKAGGERTNIAKEVGALGIAMMGYAGRLAGIEQSMAKLEPQVSTLQHGRVLDEGKLKGVGMAWEGGSKVVAALVGLGGLIVVVAGWLSWVWTQTGGRHPGGN